VEFERDVLHLSLPSYKDILLVRALRTRCGGAYRTAFTSLVVFLAGFLIEIATNLQITEEELAR